MRIDMGFCCLNVINKNLKYKFNSGLCRTVNQTPYEK